MFVEYLKSAIKQIKHNGYRTVMTMLGMVVGIMAVIAVVALGNGLSDYVRQEFNGLYGNYGMIDINKSKTTEVFTRDDIYIIESLLSDINGVSPNFQGNGKVKGTKGTYLADINGGAESQIYALANPIVKGQYFTKQQVEAGQRVCVMLRTDAVKLFGTEDCIGKEVEISIAGKSASYMVVGLREQMNTMFNVLMASQDYQAIIEIPYTVCASDFEYDIDKMYEIVVYADQEKLQKRVEQARQILLNVHRLRGTNAITAYSMVDLADEIGQLMDAISLFLIVVAVISLVVGGIGIMNIMLVSVTERTKEIGIRKSIGASTGAIMMQFLCEAVIITLIGGLVGITVGFILSYIVCATIGFNLILPLSSVLGVTLFSATVGLFFGLYPAIKAAKMKPINALRV